MAGVVMRDIKFRAWDKMNKLTWFVSAIDFHTQKVFIEHSEVDLDFRDFGTMAQLDSEKQHKRHGGIS